MKLSEQQLNHISEMRKRAQEFYKSGVLDVSTLQGVLLSHHTFCETFSEFEIAPYEGDIYDSIVTATHDGTVYFSVYKQEGETH